MRIPEEIQTTYHAVGIGLSCPYVFSGALCSYTRELENKNHEALLSQATKMFAGELGAMLIITTIEAVAINGKQFTNKSEETVFIGELTTEQKRQLTDLKYYRNLSIH